MVDWWMDNGPPVYIAVAGYLGLIKDKNSRKDKGSNTLANTGDLNELARMFQGNGGMIQ